MATTTFNLKTEATKTLHAGVGAADLALEAVKEYVAEAQKRIESVQKDAVKAFAEAQKSVRGLDLQPKALRDQATTVVTARVDELSKDARARRTAIEKRVAELQGDAQKFVSTGVATYDSLAKRGERVVKRTRKETASVVDPGPVKKSTGVTTTAKKAPAKKAPAKKATAKKAPAKKATAGK
jgi:heparin binding hemagglutinin HbhA